MTTFAQAAATTVKDSTTINGMKTLDSSLDDCVNLFFSVGASRGQDIISTFERAYQADRVTALRVMAWSRDVREGAGERQLFRDVLQHLEQLHPQELPTLIALVPVIGRWDDLLSFTTPIVKKMAYDAIKHALLVEHSSLCAKWMPRKGAIAAELRNHLGLTPKEYRKTLVTLSKVVETQMCAKDWDNINFSHVPSVAAARYQKAFTRNAPEKYAEYKDALKSGNPSVKVNAGAVYPYDVLRSIKQGDYDVATAQWEALPNYIGDEMILPMIDVSGSMEQQVGDNPKMTCMDVSISLGLYLADKNTGPFKDCFLTFSARSKIEVLRGNIVEKVKQLEEADWGANTNLAGAFAEILRVGQENNAVEAQMPKILCVLSDMEFDSYTATGADLTAFETARQLYADAGYQLPKVVWWNIRARAGNVPVKFNEVGTALVSGFSPAIMKSILSADDFSPVSIMMNTINVERYSSIV